MEPIPSYNLLQSIDPTKVKVPISERFAKLTLSSNKKKHQQEQQQQRLNDPEHQGELQRLQEKRESISRDLTKQFEMSVTEGKNPLLRSESSKETDQQNSREIENEQSMDRLQVSQETELHHSNYASAEKEEKEEMDALQVSNDDDNPTQLENDLELISQKIVSLVVDSRPISLSSGSTDNLNDQLVSTESQRSSTSAENQILIVRHIPINVKGALNREDISLNLTNSTQADDNNKTYQMTDNEEEEDSDEEEEAITISDTSESHNEQEPDIMATSSLPSNSQTEGLLLPSLTDDKAERVAAFLRDVSIERRNMMEQGQLDVNDTVDQLISNNDIDKIQATLNKSKQIAAADTESMTADGDEEELTPKPVIDRDTRLKALETLMDRTELLTDDEDEEFKENKDSNRTIENAFERGLKETPRNSKAKNKNFYKTTFDKTESNLDFSISELIETPKIESKLRSVTASSENKNNSRRLANIETEENTVQSLTSDEGNITPPHILTNEEASNCLKQVEENCQTPKDNNPHRLAKEDTLPNSTITDIAKAISEIYDYTPDYKTPKKSSKVRPSSSISLHSTPSSSKDSGEHKHDSIINSSTEHDTTAAPEESIVISETDEESIEQQKGTINSDDNKKLSNSFHNNEDSSSDDSADTNEYQMSQLKMSMASISISAKINIKIHIPSTTSTETSEDDESHKKQKKHVHNKKKSFIKENNVKEQEEEVVQEISKESESPNQSSASSSAENVSSKTCKQMQRRTIVNENALVCSDKSPDSPEVVEDEKFLTEAEKLLTQLYGKSWQTPEVIRTLKRTSQTGDRKSNNAETSSFKIPDNVENLKDQKSVNKSVVEESLLDDFSIFRRDIVTTNLNSTRLVTSPKMPTQQNKEVFSVPRNLRTTATRKGEVTKATAATPVSKTSFRTPVAKVVTNKGRVDNGRWRQLIDDDSNSEGDNASDDEDADESWSKNASEIEDDFTDSDNENTPKPRRRIRKNNTSKRAGGGGNNTSKNLAKLINKSKEGELIYLDLTKDEVEVQEEVPESPPANHDATFATHLQDILKTCRREDKPKLPASNKKTKRKLFTPQFGDEDYEIVKTDKEEDLPKEQVTNLPNCSLNNKEEELLEDCDNCPFDSQGRPKVLTLINKQLESVKMGKPIFQLTPTPKRREKASPFSTKTIKNHKESNDSASKSNTITDNNFKTPLTTKSKGPAKSLRDLCQTPDFKYSFLKSLDVTVSKAFCHPDALYYRDNYRTKKEDLSKILYDLYNEKLFDNKLNVPISWNKKLSNTAGRCLNKKKMGNRLSAVELSDKVLTSADRLRCTLIHELCHAATWVFNGEGGHGAKWKEWARRANATFPELPKIGVCHQYDIEYKYTYKCTLCAAKSHAHSKSKKVENIRCSYCHGAIEIFMNKKDKDGNIMPTPVREATGFAKFVKDNYKKFKRDDLKHADVMKLLSAEFASLKV